MQHSNMKTSLLILMLSSPIAVGQTLITSDGDWIEVPEGKRAVFIKDTMPVEHCVVTCVAPVMEPEVPTTSIPDENCCPEGELCVSPAVQCED